MKKFVLIPADKYHRLLKNEHVSVDDKVEFPENPQKSELVHSNLENSISSDSKVRTNTLETSHSQDKIFVEKPLADKQPNEGDNTLKLVPPPGIPDDSFSLFR